MKANKAYKTPTTVSVREMTQGQLSEEIAKLTRRVSVLNALLRGEARFTKVKREGYHVKAYDVEPYSMLLVHVDGDAKKGINIGQLGFLGAQSKPKAGKSKRS